MDHSYFKCRAEKVRELHDRSVPCWPAHPPAAWPRSLSRLLISHPAHWLLELCLHVWQHLTACALHRTGLQPLVDCTQQGITSDALRLCDACRNIPTLTSRSSVVPTHALSCTWSPDSRGASECGRRLLLQKQSDPLQLLPGPLLMLKLLL